jgi:hypothetical protein
MSSILGAENWTKTKTTWKKLNNIYQAAANVINSIQTIIDSTRSIMELGTQMTGKIGNALRSAGCLKMRLIGSHNKLVQLLLAKQS